jgi:hypothetical protein
MSKLLYSNENPVNQNETTLSLENLLFAKGDSTVFVETGTNVGSGVQQALNAGFEKIISIECIPSLYENSKNRFLGNKNVNLIFGNSREKLFPSIKNIKQKIVFWLDGHEYYDIPLIEELEQIKNSSRDDHTILIDDVRMMGSSEWGNFPLQSVIDKIKEINLHYQISYLNSYMGSSDILLAKIN